MKTTIQIDNPPPLGLTINAVNDWIGRLGSSGLAVIAGRPGIGKTALALNLLDCFIPQDGKCVAILSREMTRKQIYLQMACSKAGVGLWDYQQKEASKEGYFLVQQLLEKYESFPLEILAPDVLEKENLQFKVKPTVGLLIIDSVGLVEKPIWTRIRNWAENQNLMAIVLTPIPGELGIPPARLFSDLEIWEGCLRSGDSLLVLNGPDSYIPDDAPYDGSMETDFFTGQLGQIEPPASFSSKFFPSTMRFQ